MVISLLPRCHGQCGSRLRDECLAAELFVNLFEARVVIDDWRINYNTYGHT